MEVEQRLQFLNLEADPCRRQHTRNVAKLRVKSSLGKMDEFGQMEIQHDQNPKHRTLESPKPQRCRRPKIKIAIEAIWVGSKRVPKTSSRRQRDGRKQRKAIVIDKGEVTRVLLENISPPKEKKNISRRKARSADEVRNIDP